MVSATNQDLRGGHQMPDRDQLDKGVRLGQKVGRELRIETGEQRITRAFWDDKGETISRSREP